MFTPSALGTGRAAAMAAVLLAALLGSGAYAAPEPEEPRESTSKHYVEGGRSASAPTAVSQDRYGPLVTEGPRDKPGSAQSGSGKTSGQAMESSTHDFWIFFADVVLFGDDDGDGYHYGIDLLFDADTIYEVADVYAVLYLSLEGGPWNEYAVTEDFSIFGATSDDEFVVVTELESGFPRGSYDILIELYDAFDGTFLASLGPEDTSELGYLPLEDFNRDDPDFDGGHHHHRGGGALGFPMLAFLSIIVMRRIGRRRPRAGCYSAGFPTGAGAWRAVRMTLRPHPDSESK